ncbi:hypothetical protein [Sphingomonas sp. M1-B02]|uniref:hypothetical protein n=1 Tax=Sphingomonas sp. M1-B02 TaxID=3114300 RepID=UPI00223FF677|nr:hypothetical protein [Sphingomonas sp. S6-11]UZK67673.1 hypothetical protein OKW87_07545 [Sphingomonas sp. S6-11]
MKKAQRLRIGITNIINYTTTADGQAKLNARISTIATGESMLNASVYGAAAEKDRAG